jgi:hypothetical protein
MTRTTSIRLLSALALACTLSACDSGDAPKQTETGKPATTAAKPVADPSPVAPRPEDRAPAPDSPQAKVELAATVAKEISAAPELADDILDRHGLDRDKFDAIIFEIAADPALTKAYMAARRSR